MNRSYVLVVAAAFAACNPPPNNAASTNAALSALTISGGTLSPAFDAETTSYTGDVPFATDATTVTATTADGKASIKVNDDAVESGTASAAINLAEGANALSVVVTAEDGVTTSTYSLVITRAAETPAKSTNASLSELSLGAGALSPAFSADTTSYTIDVPFSTDSTTVTAVVAESHATLSLDGQSLVSGTESSSINLAFGTTTIAVVVTAEDGTTTKTYSVVINRPTPSADATLSALTSSAGALSPAFSPSTTGYAVSVTSGIASVTVTATTSQVGATLTVQGTSVNSAAASAPIVLSDGANAISVIVTAQDGTTTRTYTITVNRPSTATDATLSALTVDQSSLVPAFSSSTDDYSIEVDNSVTDIRFTPTATRPGATITVDGNAVTSGAQSGPFSLSLPDTYDVLIVVTAEDGTTTKTYTVHVHRLSDVSLSGIVLSDGTLTPVFDPDTLAYAATGPFATTGITVTATLTDTSSALQVNNVATASGVASAVIDLAPGDNTITLKVTGNGGNPVRTYTIVFTRALDPESRLASLAVVDDDATPMPVALDSVANPGSGFDPDDLDYTANVPNTVNAVTLTPATVGPNATIEVSVGSVSVTPTGGDYTVALGGPSSSTQIDIVVTAEDGLITSSYTVTVDVAP